MGMGGGTQQTSTNAQQTLPPWLDQAQQNTLGMAGNVLANNQVNPLQQQAWGTAGAYGSMAPGALGQAYNVETQNANYQSNPDWLGPLANLIGGSGGSGGASMGSYFGGGGGGSGTNATYNPAATSTVDMSQLQQVDPRSILDYNRQDYTNPYTDDVVNSTMSDIDRQRQQAQNGNAASASGAGAFGGSRQAIQSALTDSEYDRNSAQSAAQLRDAAFNNATGLMQGDMAAGTAADQFNSSQNLQTLLANAGYQNAGSQFNAGQANALAQSQIGANAQIQSAGLGASASMFNSQNSSAAQRYAAQLQAAGQLAQLGMGGDLNAATLRGNTASQLANFGQNGLNAGGTAGNDIYHMPQQDLSWYSSILGGLPSGHMGSNTTTTAPAPAGTNPWIQGGLTAAQLYMMYGG